MNIISPAVPIVIVQWQWHCGLGTHTVPKRKSETISACVPALLLLLQWTTFPPSLFGGVQCSASNPGTLCSRVSHCQAVRYNQCFSQRSFVQALQHTRWIEAVNAIKCLLNEPAKEKRATKLLVNSSPGLRERERE